MSVRPVLSTKCSSRIVRSSFFIFTVTERISIGSENWKTPEAMGCVRVPIRRNREGVGWVQRPKEEEEDAEETKDSEEDKLAAESRGSPLLPPLSIARYYSSCPWECARYAAASRAISPRVRRCSISCSSPGNPTPAPYAPSRYCTYHSPGGVSTLS